MESARSYQARPRTFKKFVNIFFRPEDAQLNDLDTLRTMHDHISTGRASVTDYPAMEHHSCCFSMPLDGIFGYRSDVYAQANRQIYLWIRNVPTRGLPFERRFVFRNVN